MKPVSAPLAIERFRVVMADTDAARVIYYVAPFRWTERMVSGWLASVGVPISGMLARGEGLPAVHAESTYRGPLRLDDEIVGTLRVDARSSRSITFRCEFAKVGASDPAVEVELTEVYIRTTGDGVASTSLPETLDAALDAAFAAAASS